MTKQIIWLHEKGLKLTDEIKIIKQMVQELFISGMIIIITKNVAIR